MLAGQGSGSDRKIDLVMAEAIAKKTGNCIEKMRTDPILGPEAYPALRKWYDNEYLPMGQNPNSTYADDALVEKSLVNIIKGKPYESYFLNRISECFSE